MRKINLFKKAKWSPKSPSYWISLKGKKPLKKYNSLLDFLNNKWKVWETPFYFSADNVINTIRS